MSERDDLKLPDLPEIERAIATHEEALKRLKRWRRWVKQDQEAAGDAPSESEQGGEA